MNVSPIQRRIFKGLAALAMLGILGVAALLGSLWLEHGTELTLPAPTGPFAVGRWLYDWVDDKTPDVLAPVPGTRRELLVWIWYPAAAGQAGAVIDDYVPASVRAPAGRVGAPLVFRFLTRDLSKVHGHSLRDADVSPQQPSYAVVIIRAGASLEVANYSTLAEDLASHGYVVVGLDAPYRTFNVVFPDGRVIARTQENNLELVSGEELTRRASKLLAAWTADIAFVLDRLEWLNASDPSAKFTGRLDMTRVGVFGHSFGGAQAAQFCHEDSRCKAGIDIDGALFGSVIQDGIDKPFLFLLSGNGDFSSDAEIRRFQADIQSVYNRLPADGRLRVVIRGANHFTFNDDGALLKSRVIRGLFRVFGKLGIGGRRQLAVTAYCVRSFFDAHLKGAGVSRLEISSPLYPEIQVIE
ncbi:MAG: family membership [Bryobacteraceae bacterium]|jgi:predicted dienelactone hydrolase